ncbi:MAG: hypothetical protein HY298_12590 [Verrucomicrobia bacterium]|nr:hypothetical protein [Verrucomicrobiota bacterium]
MPTIKQIAGLRWVMLLVAVGLALYFVLVFRPLAHQADALDGPLAEVWQDLVNVSLESSGIRDLDLGKIKKTQEKLQASLLATEKAGQLIAARVELEPEIRAKLKEEFLLVDYQNDRQKRIEQLTALAKTQQVTLDAAALAGFPEHKAEMKEPNLLWAELAIVHHILTTAINSKVSTIKNLSVLPLQMYRVPGGTEVNLEEIPVRIELVAPMESAASFLLALPLRAEEMKTAGQPESRPGKPALFLDKLILKKQTPEKAAEVSLDVVLCGFVRALDVRAARPEAKTKSE